MADLHEGEVVRRDMFCAILVFSVVWLVTFNAAVVNGDDINHFQSSYGGKVFFPHFHRGWIPNRLMDLYGRSLAGSIFNLCFFPIHAIFGIGFFWAYKIFNATIFAAFVSITYRYIAAQLTAWLGPVDLLLRLLVAAALVAILPWTNEVRMICYQVPAFVSFAVALEISKRLFRLPVLDEKLLMILSFVAAFSLEAYSAILLISVLTGLAVMQLSRQQNRGDFMVMLFLGGCCAVAVFMTVLFSERAGASAHFAPVAGYEALFLRARWPADPIVLIYPLAILAGAAGLSAMILRLRGDAARRLATKFPPWFQAVAMQAFVVSLASVLVAGLISIEANQNYLSFRSYPWGDLLLMAAFSAVMLLAASLGWLTAQCRLGNPLQLLMFVALTRLMMFPLAHVAADYQKSQADAAAYAAVLAGGGPVIDTGLQLDTVPMQVRPLPTADSPQWFIDGYHYLFATYYGVTTEAVFK